MANQSNFVVKNGLVVGTTPVIAANGQWIGSATGLIGPQGYQGSPGATGVTGAQGVTGVSGFQGYQGGAWINLDNGTAAP